MKRYVCIIVFLSLKHVAQAQFLFSESFVMIPLDTTKKYAGNIAGTFNQQTQKNLITQFSTRAEFARRIRNHVLTLANNLQVIRDGRETVLSGGYVYVRFRDRIDRKVYPEFSGQYQWLEARGMVEKVALTANMRWRINRTEQLQLATAAGFVAEYERWNYSGVPDNKLPAQTPDKRVYNPRFNWYFSYDQSIGDRFNIDAGIYYQVRIDSQWSRPRLGSHLRGGLKLTRSLTLSLTWKGMYDYEPVVPVDKLWYNINNELVFTF